MRFETDRLRAASRLSLSGRAEQPRQCSDIQIKQAEPVLSTRRLAMTRVFSGLDYKPVPKADASRASASMSLHFPAATRSFGATQLPPAQSTFDKLR